MSYNVTYLTASFLLLCLCNHLSSVVGANLTNFVLIGATGNEFVYLVGCFVCSQEADVIVCVWILGCLLLPLL